MWHKKSEFPDTIILSSIEVNASGTITIWINAKNNLPESASQLA
ncbi:MAG: hypothetical protein ACJAWQ_000170 [Paraglaciecola sp.]|jgi:hypothetical protein